jgi:hypothetical protein
MQRPAKRLWVSFLGIGSSLACLSVFAQQISRDGSYFAEELGMPYLGPPDVRSNEPQKQRISSAKSPGKWSSARLAVAVMWQKD